MKKIIVSICFIFVALSVCFFIPKTSEVYADENQQTETVVNVFNGTHTVSLIGKEGEGKLSLFDNLVQAETTKEPVAFYQDGNVVENQYAIHRTTTDYFSGQAPLSSGTALIEIPSAIKYYLNKGATVEVSASVGHLALSTDSRDQIEFSLNVLGQTETIKSTAVWNSSSTTYRPTSWITFSKFIIDENSEITEDSKIEFSFQSVQKFGSNNSLDFYIFNPTITFTVVGYSSQENEAVEIQEIVVKDKGYDGTTTAEIDYVVLSGVNFGEDLFITGLSAEFSSSNAGATPIISGTPELCGAADGVTLNQNISATISGKILKRDVVITAKETTQIYGASEPTEIEYGVFNCEKDYLEGNLSREYATKKEVGEYRIINENLKAGDTGDNYNLILHSNKYIIIPAKIIVESVEIEKDYDGTSVVDGTELTIKLGIDTDEDGLINVYFGLGEDGKLTDKESATVKYFLSDNVYLNYSYSFENVNAGEYTINNFSGYLTGTALQSYSLDLNQLSTKATINQIKLTIEADEKTKVYGDNDPELTYSITEGSLVGDEVLEGNIERVTGEDVGIYEINIGTLKTSNPNYEILFIENNLTISKRELAVKADNVEKFYGDNDPQLTYQITFGNLIGNDQLNIELETNSTGVVGTYLITAKKDSNGEIICNPNYKIVNFEEAQFNIKKSLLKIIITVLDKNYDGNPKASYKIEYETKSLTFENDDIGIDVLRLTAVFEDKNVGEKTATFKYNENEIIEFSSDIVQGQKKSNYEISFEINKKAKISKREVTVEVYQDYEKEFGNKDPEFQYTTENIVDGEVLEGKLSRQQGELPDEYNIIPGTITNENNPNYEISFVGKTLRIVKRLVEIEAEDLTKVFGESDPVPKLKLLLGRTLPEGVNLEDLIEGYVIRTEGENVGEYEYLQGSVKLNFNSENNYELKFVQGGSLTVKKREIKIEVETVKVKYGQEYKLSYTVVGEYQPLLSTDIIIVPKEEAVNAGTYSLKAVASENYLITIVTAGVLEIEPASIKILPKNQSKIYGNEWGELVVSNLYDIISGEIYNNDELIISGRLNKEPGEIVGLYEINQGTAVFNSNYDVTIQNNQSFEIKRRPVIVEAISVYYYLDIYETATLNLKYTTTNLFSNDSLFGQLELQTDIDGVGDYKILQGTITNENNPNYEISYTEGLVEIKKRQVYITSFHEKPEPGEEYEPAKKVYDGTSALPEGVDEKNFEVIVTARTFNGKFREDKDEDELFDGITLSLDMEENVGAYPIMIALKESNLEMISKYYDVEIQQNSIIIEPKPIEIKIIGKEFDYGEWTPTADDLVCEFNEDEIIKTADGKSTLTIELKCENLVLKNGVVQSGEYQIELVDPKNNNYVIIKTYDEKTGGKFIVNKRIVEIKIDSVSKVYGEQDPEIVYTYDKSLIFESDVITEKVYREEGEKAGQYKIFVEFTTENENYEFIYNEATFTIYKRTISLEVNPQNKVYDGTTKVDIQYNYGNIKQGDDIKVNIEGAFVDANIGNNKEIVITKWEIIGQNSENYQIVALSYLTANITRKSITEENVTITVEDDNTLLDDNVILKVRKIQDKEIKNVIKGKEIVTGYEIILERNGMLITDFGGDLTVKIANLHPAVKEEMYVINQDGKSYLLSTAIEPEGVVFETQNLGTVVVAYDQNNVLMYALIGSGAGLLLIGGIITMILIVKKRKNNLK